MTDPIVRLERFLARLANQHPKEEAVFSLRLAETSLHALSRAGTPVPVIAVIGPTQTGKSTVVNILAGGEYVEASPLAAHTRRASAVAVNVATADGFLRLEHEAEPTFVQTDSPACVIWDTPDFDSNASARYRQEVARVCALADLIVVVVSKEKYADRSVWGVLQAIAPLETPTLICLNKCESHSDKSILAPVIRRRLAENPSVRSDIPVATLPSVSDGDLAALLEQAEVQSFRREIFANLQLLSVSDRKSALDRFIRANWEDWVAPVQWELECVEEWRKVLETHTEGFIHRYRAEYIDHARHHDVAQKAMLGLLELLEIPVLAGPLSKSRRILTWPFRKLAESFGNPVEPGKDRELDVLDAALAHYLLSLRNEVMDRTHPWWHALAHELSASESALNASFRASIDQYRQAFAPRIDHLSEELYDQLKKSPVTLNALRAARVSADAGGVLLAIKTGALGLYDALLAPAVISLTSYLTESAVGQYMKTVIEQLKREQLEQVSTIIRQTIELPLQEVQLRGPDLFGISRTELDDAVKQMEALRQ